MKEQENLRRLTDDMVDEVTHCESRLVNESNSGIDEDENKIYSISKYP